MGVLPSEELVVIKVGKQSEPTTITVNCPNRLGLACDLVRIIFEFGLSIVRGDLSTDGRWCLLVFWAMPRFIETRHVRWGQLKNRLIAECPPENQVFSVVEVVAMPKRLFLLQVYSGDRAGLLHDLSRVLWEQEVTIHKVKVSTCPDGKIVDLLLVSDNQCLLPQEGRARKICNAVKEASACPVSRIQLQEAGPEYGSLSCTPAMNLPKTVIEELTSSSLDFQSAAKVTIDNLLSPAHTLVQVSCSDRKGLLYDCLRALKDFNLQVAYGRLSLSAYERGHCDIDLFITQADGRKILDPEKQRVVTSRLRHEVACPVRVAVLPRGPDKELIVAAPIEVCGRGRPRVLFDVTLALKMLNVCIFQADIGRHTVGERQWEIYRFLLMELGEQSPSARALEQVRDRVKHVLVG